MKTLHVFSHITSTPDVLNGVVKYDLTSECLRVHLDKGGIMFYPLLHVHCFGELPLDQPIIPDNGPEGGEEMPTTIPMVS